MKIVEYKQGMTSIWCDGEKIIIKNPNGSEYVKDNVEQIFGMGEYAKIYTTRYSDALLNKYGGPFEISSGYIPERAVKDLKKAGDKNKFFGELE
jgi:hypothetical protein